MDDDGSVCDLGVCDLEYPSINSFLNRRKKDRNPKTIDCPICKEKGRIA